MCPPVYSSPRSTSLRQHRDRLAEQFALLAQERAPLRCPAETWAAKASARCRSSSVNGFCQQRAVEVQHAERFARRAEQHAQHGRHRPVGDALGRRQFGIVIDARTEIRLAPGEASLGDLLAVVETPGLTLNQPVGQRPNLQLLIGPVRQDDRSALGVEHVHGVVQDGVEQFVFLVDVVQMVAGSQAARSSWSPGRSVWFLS